MPEVLQRGFKIVLNIRQPEYLSEHDDLLSESWHQIATQVLLALNSCDCFAGTVFKRDVVSAEIEADKYVRCEYCGSEIDPAADDECCEHVASSYDTLQVKAEDSTMGITPADVVRAALERAAKDD